ncbi:antitoxin VapB family protein [Halorussus limi]|uniref:Antitoxin VapB family protein n=1 Tax=Halorussus limi TaxID=2938695 RepID=A0A8U0HWM0_9EURY|nr:antitoxin VapB family protein [Halorussus limi]UPV75229.1 antitoxin VapB family protein [Halorussus limi]
MSDPNADSTSAVMSSTRMSRHVRLDDDLYERIKANRQEGESFSDTIERLIDNRSLRDLQDVFDSEQVDEMRDAVKIPEEEDTAKIRELGERFD